MRKAKMIGLAAAMVAMLNGCLLASPYWNQQLDDHTEAVPLQTFTYYKTIPVKFECATANHGGLFPAGAVKWVKVTTVKPQPQALLDTFGGKVHGAGTHKPLPAACWRLDPANSVWYTAVRATQNKKVIGTDQKYFYTFDKKGLECLGRETGKEAAWLGWLDKGCDTGYYYTIIYSKS